MILKDLFKTNPIKTIKDGIDEVHTSLEERSTVAHKFQFSIRVLTIFSSIGYWGMIAYTLVNPSSQDVVFALYDKFNVDYAYFAVLAFFVGDKIYRYIKR